MANIYCPQDGRDVTVIATDGSKVSGSIVVGADGARSVVRRTILGPEIGASQTMPYIATRATLKFPTAEQALTARRLHPLNVASTHPDGIWAWISRKLTQL